MTKIILIALSLILCIIGLAEVLHAIKLFLFGSNHKKLSFSLVILSKENYLQQLRYVEEQRSWLGSKYADYILAINDYLEPTDIRDALEYAKKFGIIICSFNQLERVVSHLNKGRL